MERNLNQLSDTSYDVVVVGGGAYGAFAAWDAALRGLSVALVERGDFAGATSSNSLKIIHGGLRYLQHADFRRMRQSIRERSVLLRLAPHLIRPLPFLIPTYGHTLRGREVMAVALRVNDWIGWDRNRGQDADHRLPASRVVSRQEVLRRVPGIDADGLTGGAMWYDAQVHNSERLVLSVLHSAVAAGATVANYVEATGFLTEGDRVVGIKARDVLSGERFEICGRLVLNTTGPWVGQLVASLRGGHRNGAVPLSRAMNLVIGRQLFPDLAVGIWSWQKFADRDAVVNKGGRLLFVTPWRDVSVIGTTHTTYSGSPDAFAVTESDIQAFLDEFNEAYPEAGVSRDQVRWVYGGLLPAADESGERGEVTLLKHFQLQDHRSTDGIDGLVSVVSVKLTTARDVASRAVDLLFRKLGHRPPPCRTVDTPVHGGAIDDVSAFLAEQQRRLGDRLAPEVIAHLAHTYGTSLTEVLLCGEEVDGGREPLAADTKVTAAEVVYGIRQEMAQKLADIVWRRTELGTAGLPQAEAIERCAEIMAAEMGWGEERMRQEIREVRACRDSLVSAGSSSHVEADIHETFEEQTS